MTWESAAVALLESSLVRPIVLAAIAWLALCVFRVRHPAQQHAVWTAVAVCMLLVPLASMLAPHWSWRVLPGRHATPSPAAQSSPSAPSATAPSEAAGAVPPDAAAPTTSPWPSTSSLLLAIYAAGLAAMLAYRIAGWLLLRRILARARPIRSNVLRESDDVLAPVAAGLLRPSVILPAGWRDWPDATKRAVLAHEFAHLRRVDILSASLARTVQSIFWFHPLAWWLSSKISELAELSCDLAALDRSRDPAAYSRILLEFSQTIYRAGARTTLPGLAMATRSNVGRRIDRILELSDRFPGAPHKLMASGALLSLAAAPLACLAATVTLAEQNPRPRPRPIPKFDVISVKPCTPTASPEAGAGRGGGGAVHASPGRLSLECQTVDSLIRNAYLRFPDGKAEPLDPASGLRLQRLSHRVLTQQIKGSPAWLTSDRFTIDATAEGSPSREMMIGPMMQSLLASRFALLIRTEMRNAPVYALTLAKGGAKLHPAEQKCRVFDVANLPESPTPGETPEPLCAVWFHARDGEERAPGASMNDLARDLSRLLDLDVIDKTGIDGRFDITMQLSPVDALRGLAFAGPRQAEVEAMRAAAPDPPGSTVYVALEKLGLKVETTKAPTEFLVIDHVEKPSGN